MTEEAFRLLGQVTEVFYIMTLSVAPAGKNKGEIELKWAWGWRDKP